MERGLPTARDLVDPAWVDPDAPVAHEVWSLVCPFSTPPREQGSPSTATVRFLVDDAPHDRLRAGATLRLLERGTGQYASVAILD